MSRQIKFRAWSTFDTGHMHYWNDGFNYRWFDRYGDKYVILMQFTGLQDRNGVDIYEGDIVSGYKVNQRVIEWQDWTHDIEVSMVGFCFPWLKSDNVIEVIGNIYENPDLLGEAGDATA